MTGGSPVTAEDFEKYKEEMKSLYEQLRKLVNEQAIAIDAKLQKYEDTLKNLIYRKPDVGMVRDAWIREIPKIREDIKKLDALVAPLVAKQPTKKVA